MTLTEKHFSTSIRQVDGNDGSSNSSSFIFPRETIFLIKKKATDLLVLFVGTETETKAFMAICVETLKRFVNKTVGFFMPSV